VSGQANRDDYPRIGSITAEASGEPFSLSMLERFIADYPEQQRKRQQYTERQAREQSEYCKARYARFLGVESLSAEQEKELWDGMAEAWWRHMVRTTNILEWLAE